MKNWSAFKIQRKTVKLKIVFNDIIVVNLKI